LTGLFLCVTINILLTFLGYTVNKLLLNCRPATVFEPANKDHRRAYFNFLKNSTWGRSPYQFLLDPGFEDVPTMCRHRLCEYYVGREFGDKLNDPPPAGKNTKLTVVKLKSKERVD
jgi:hypothetical protein